MKVIVTTALAMMAAGVDAQTTTQQYPSCDLTSQHSAQGTMGGSITDPRQAHISMRANVLQADLGNARKARRLSQADADRLYKRVEAVKTGADRYTRKQGFLSAGEVASYDRELDAITLKVCHR